MASSVHVIQDFESGLILGDKYGGHDEIRQTVWSDAAGGWVDLINPTGPHIPVVAGGVLNFEGNVEPSLINRYVQMEGYAWNGTIGNLVRGMEVSFRSDLAPVNAN